MNLSQLKMFVEVVRLGSLSEAARHHNLTQPAVTRKIQRLEKEIGFLVFERGEGHQMILTRPGRQFLVFAQRVLFEYNQLQESWRTQRQEVKGPLRLVASTTPGEFLVPTLLASFISRYPLVQPSLVILDSTEVAHRVLSREFDAGFTGWLPGNPALRAIKIWDDEIVLAVPPAHPLALGHRPEITLEELQDQVLLERETGSGTMQSVRHILEEKGRELPPHRVAMVLGSTQAIISSVAAGLGSGFVSGLAARKAAGQIVALRLAGFPLLRALYLIYEEQVLQSGSLLVREFINFTQLAGHGPDEADDPEEE